MRPDGITQRMEKTVKQLNKMVGALATALLMGLALPAPASAGVTMTTYNFYGLCDDCLGPGGPATVPFLSENTNDGLFSPVTGTLMLVDYTPGTPLQLANLVSFTYDGSSIIDPFTVNTFLGVSGSLDMTGNVLSSFNLGWDGSLSPEVPVACEPGFECGLLVLTDGIWIIGAFADFGIDGTFAGAPIPEPGTLALFGLGLASLGFARRKRMI
jgi:hypothetical protein